jgi:hypothetical protein
MSVIAKATKPIQTKNLNVTVHPDIKKRIDHIVATNFGLRLQHVMARAIQLFLQDHEKGDVCISTKKRDFKGKPHYNAYIPLELHQGFHRLYEENRYGHPKGSRLTKTKLLEQILEYWLEKEGHLYE